jgi:hypothetical protein
MVPFISWGAKLSAVFRAYTLSSQAGKWVSQHQKLTMQILSRMRVSLCGQMRRCALHCVDRGALMRACGISYPRACVKESGKNSGSISPQSLMNLLLCRSAEAGFWTCKWIRSTGKQMKPKWGRNLYLLPSMVANLFVLFSSMCEQKVSTYMPSWALLVMTVVMQKVRKKIVKVWTRIKQELNNNMSIKIKTKNKWQWNKFTNR